MSDIVKPFLSQQTCLQWSAIIRKLFDSMKDFIWLFNTTVRRRNLDNRNVLINVFKHESVLV